MIDINLIPPEYRPRPWALALTIALIVLILAGGGGSYFFFHKNDLAHDRTAALESKIDSTKTQIDKLLKNPEVQKYQEQIKKAEEELKRLETLKKDYELFQAQQIRWGKVLDVLLRNASEGIEFTSISQKSEEAAEVLGTARSQLQVVGFAQSLKNSGNFADVLVTFPGPTRGSKEPEGSRVNFSLVLQFKQGGQS
ncbi:MAG: hypothetical protein DRI26_08970 [Chloroflexi bacterium]|nr:MAG: hypothetical protein DRI26_08970 [Chloroflexota bacterium]